jgi:excisionase family DNA binding protein
MSDVTATSNEAPFDGYITIREAVSQSGYSNQYIRRLMREHKLHGIKVGHLWLVAIVSLNTYLDQASSNDDRRYGPHQ